ncbi:hypothetical protein K431DRAFT_324438 [Polychaeton citri CBS 116435]|uniref:Uncharacterized protein n=1 Tax=Polychaeton citri CBS 116435 TaxID=1314669 RepID=A0A9P4US14_9PEZI|nr:hypothetical protein K431DRAFT_324438 [Polychaeton citri CBS 116435]
MSLSSSATPSKTPVRNAMEIQRESSIHRLLNESSQAASSSTTDLTDKASDATGFAKRIGDSTLKPSPPLSGYSNNFLLHYVVDNDSPEAAVDPPPSLPRPPRNIEMKRNTTGASYAATSMDLDTMVTPTKRSASTTGADDGQVSRPARKIKLIHNKIDNTDTTMPSPDFGRRDVQNATENRGTRTASTTKKVGFPTLIPEVDQGPDNDQSPDLNNDGDEQADHPDERKGISGRELVASGMGTSTEPALIAPIRDKKTGERHKVLSTPWRCGERHCNTGQTWYPRQAVGRKCVSQYFGRNKKETNSIPGDVWNFHCRKHYQRESYSRQFLDITQKIVAEVNGLRSQVDRLRLWRPDAKFKIQLTKAVHDRLQVFQTAYRRYEGTEYDARKAGEEAWKKKFNVVEERKMQPADKFHPILAEEFGTANLEQEAGSYDDIDRVLEWILVQAQSGRLTVIPPFELLILSKEDGEVENGTFNNYQRYMYDVVDKNEGFKETQMEVETSRAVQGPHRQHVRVRDTRTRLTATRSTGELVEDASAYSMHRRFEEADETYENSETRPSYQAEPNDEDMGGLIHGNSQIPPTATAQTQSVNSLSPNFPYALGDAGKQSATDFPTTAYRAMNAEPSSFKQKSAKKATTPSIPKTPTRTSPRRKRPSNDNGTA